MSGPLRPWVQEAPAPTPPEAAPRPPTPPSEAGKWSWDKGNPNWLLLALALSLVGMVGVGGVLYLTKFLHYHAYVYGFPTRVLFVFSIGLAAAPFLLTVAQRVPAFYLIPPLVAIFFLYPLFAPYGIPYSIDAVYNFQFARALLLTHTWQPTLFVTNQAVIYSYFPAAAVFNAELAAFTGLPLSNTFLWSQMLLRFLVIPGAVYAICFRLFGTRSAVLGVLLYSTVASIEMNLPTQQDFGVTFVALAVLALVLLWEAPRIDAPGLRVAVVVFSSFVVLSHHLSSYVFAILLAGIAFIPWIIKRRDPYPSLRSWAVFLRYGVVLLLYTAIVAVAIAPTLAGYGVTNVDSIITSASHFAVAVGATFPLYQTVWIGISVGLIALFSILTFILTYRTERLSLVTFGILASLITAIVAIPFVATGFSFLVLRLMEYAGLFLCPAAAWWLVNRLARRPEHAPTSARRSASPAAVRTRARAYAFAAMAVAFVIVAGGSLVPLPTRDQLASPSSILISSPLNVNQSAYEGALWANSHLNRSEPVWGDEFVYTTIGGFGQFNLSYDPWPLFNGTGFNGSALQNSTVARLGVGSYVVVDVYMTQQPWMPAVFPGPNQPIWNSTLTPAVLGTYLQKFENPRYFSLVYQDSIFTIYQVRERP